MLSLAVPVRNSFNQKLYLGYFKVLNKQIRYIKLDLETPSYYSSAI